MKQKFYSIIANSKIRNIIFFILGISITSLIIYLRAKDIKGPSVFGDEAAYFNLARIIHNEWNYGGHIQYNPLYSLLISFFFNISDVLKVYELAKIFNTIVFSSILIPIFYISKLFLSDTKKCIFLSAVTVLLPFGAMTAIIWADSLFYSLYIWCIYSYFLFIKTKKIHRGILLGVLLGLLFLTKQSGFILSLATLPALAYEYYISKDRKSDLLKILSVFISLILVIGPWIVRNILTPGGGLMGYKSATETFSSYFFTLVFSLGFFKNFLYQISYLAISSFFLFFVMFIYFVIHIRQVELQYRSFIILILMHILGLSFLISLFQMSYKIAFNTPVMEYFTLGRYLAPIIPFIIIIGLKQFLLLNFTKKRQWTIILLISLCISFNIAIFSPLESVTAHGIINSADTSYMLDIIGLNRLFQIHYPATLLEASLFSLAALLMFLIAIIVKTKLKFKQVFYLFLLFGIFVGWRAADYVSLYSAHQKHLNNIYRYVLKNKIPSKKFIVDNALLEPQWNTYNWMNIFWYGNNVHKITPEENDFYFTTYQKILPNQLVAEYGDYKIYYIK